MTKDPRHIAFSILLESGTGRVTLDRALDRHDPKILALPLKDRALCHAIVFGVLRHRGRIDHLIRAFSSRPFDRLDAGVLEILRVALFQMVFLDRVPDFAAINTAVQLTKQTISKKSTGFVNAVLRQAAREYKDIDIPSASGQFFAHLRVACSIPKWLGSRWTGVYGQDRTLALCQSLMEIPPLTLRVNRLKTDRHTLAKQLRESGRDTEDTRFSPDGLDLTGPGICISNLPGYPEGLFQVQDEAAQMVSQVLNPCPGESILDACAGLGGKTCHMAQLMENRGRIVAADIDAAKLDRLEAEASRLGICIVEGAAMDVSRATTKDTHGYFDRVLVDAPCTGLGVIRRNPDTRWKRSIKDIQRMAARQKKILNAAASLVSPGGTLVYAVCSCEAEENQEVIDYFLARRKDFIPDSSGMARTAAKLFSAAPDRAWFKTFPDPGRMDGFFVARLKRKECP
jgi:16S rRNA (cytosine967-C5)-methyltransferase